MNSFPGGNVCQFHKNQPKNPSSKIHLKRKKQLNPSTKQKITLFLFTFFLERGLLAAGAEEIDFADVSSQLSLPANVNPGDASKCQVHCRRW